jgi:hypothetical protein
LQKSITNVDTVWGVFDGFCGAAPHTPFTACVSRALYADDLRKMEIIYHKLTNTEIAEISSNEEIIHSAENGKDLMGNIFSRF